MSNEDHIWFDEHGEIDKGRVHNGNLFASNLDRLRCIRAGLNERQWLKDHPGVWRPLEDVLREAPHEFIRRFLMHVLPSGFHRIRHYGLLASSTRAANIARARQLLAVPTCSEQPKTLETPAPDQPRMLPRPCPCCGGRMLIIETFARGCQPKHRPTPASAVIRIDTS